MLVGRDPVGMEQLRRCWEFFFFFMNFSYRGRLRAFWVYSWELGWWELLATRLKLRKWAQGVSPGKGAQRGTWETVYAEIADEDRHPRRRA